MEIFINVTFLAGGGQCRITSVIFSERSEDKQTAGLRRVRISSIKEKNSQKDNAS